MVRKLEALVDAIAHHNGYSNPENELYISRNPLGLPAISPKHLHDSKRRRVFHSLLDGYQAALYDLQVKCSGKSKSRVKSDSNLRDLMIAFGYPESMAEYVAKHLRKALGDPSINDKTALRFFVES